MEIKKEYDSGFVRVLIEQDDPRAIALTEEEAQEIEEYILEQASANLGKNPRPRFNGVFVFSQEGALIVSPHVDTLSWLREVIKSYLEKALRATDIKDSRQYTAKVQALVPYFNKLPEVLEVQNTGLQTDGWRIICYGMDEYYFDGYRGKDVTLLIDEPGRKFLERNNFKLSLGKSTIIFKLFERVRRCEVAGNIVLDKLELAGEN